MRTNSPRVALLRLILLVSASMACVRPGTSPSVARSASDPLLGAAGAASRGCSDTAFHSLALDTLEARLLQGAGGRIVRDGCRLTFLDSVGRQELTLEDVFQDGDPWMIHRYRGHLPALQAHLVERSFYEGGAYLLVFPEGRWIGIAGPPLLSPDSARFATWNMDLEAGYDPNVLQIWRRTSWAASLELALTSEDWGPSDVRWIDSTTVAWVQNFPSAELGAPSRRPTQLLLRDGLWRVELHTR